MPTCMAHWICWAIASEREFMVFVMVLVAAATFLAIGAIADWMSLPGPTPTNSAVQQVVGYLGYSGRDADVVVTAALDPQQSAPGKLAKNRRCKSPTGKV